MLVRAFALVASFLIASCIAGTAFAQAAPQPKAAAPTQSASSTSAAAEKVVNDFMAALVGGQLDAARKLMTPDAIVMANGHVLGNRDGYIDGAAKADAAALAKVDRELMRRDVKAGPEVGLVLSEKRLHAPGDSKGNSELVIETMLLVKTPEGWKIAHIHWSGRHAG